MKTKLEVSKADYTKFKEHLLEQGYEIRELKDKDNIDNIDNIDMCVYANNKKVETFGGMILNLETITRHIIFIEAEEICPPLGTKK